MSQAALNTVVRRLRAMTVPKAVKELSDAQLLERFVNAREDAAFTAIVQRHARLVWAVCSNVLRHDQDAEDALQACFLVLANKAGTIKKAHALASWLHGVAYRTSMLAKRRAALRRLHEKEKGNMAQQTAKPDVAWKELLSVLDAEVRRMPEKYSAPFILCCLEGRSGPEAARILGWKEGTVAGRLSQARKLLAKRLVRRGIDLSLVLGGLALSYRVTPAAGIVRLAVSVLQEAETMALSEAAAGVLSGRAVELALGMMKVMAIKKATIGAAVLLVCTLLVTGSGVVATQIVGDAGPGVPTPAAGRAVAMRQDAPKGPTAKPLLVDIDDQPVQKGVADDKAIRDLIQQLGDDSFDKREDASKKLVDIGEPALEFLRKAATDSTDAEIRQRSAQLARDIKSLQLGLVRILGDKKKMTGVPMKRVVVTPDGKRAIACGSLGCFVLDIETGKELMSFGEAKQNAFALGLSPDSRQLLAGTADHPVVRLYDLDTGKKLIELKGHTDTVWGALFLPGGKQALTGSWDSSIRVWDLETGMEVRAFSRVRDRVRCLALSPDGKTVAAGHFTKQSGPGTVRLWDVETGKEIKSMEGHTAEVSNVAFSPDGKTLMSSGLDKTIRLWDVATGKEMRHMTGQSPQHIEYAVFTPDGKRIVSGGTAGEGSNYAVRSWTVRVWDVASGKQLLESDDIKGGVLGVAVLPDGQRCVTASRDGLVRLWQWKK